jgi:hypothetical protein
MGACSWWFDNFNQRLYASCPTLKTGSQREANWAGVALKRYRGVPVSMRCRLDADGEIIPAMPATFAALLSFAPSIQALLRKDQEGNADKLRRASVMYKYKVHSIPPKPEIVQGTEADLRATLAANVSLDDILPVAILPTNIGSWEGINRIFKDWYDEWIKPSVNKNRYHMLMVDVAIFYNLLIVSVYVIIYFTHYILCVQMMYDHSNPTKKMKLYVGVTLAYWHTYKTMAQNVWKLGLADIFGPMFHHICPGNKLKNNFPLRVVLTYFYYLMYAYSKFKMELQVEVQDNRYPPSIKRRLQNLQDLCEFFIPVVCVCML